MLLCMKVLDLQYQYGMATESKTLNCFQIQIPSICYASEGIRLAILYPLKEKSYHSVGKAHLFIYSLKMRVSVTSSYPYFLYVLDEIPMSTYFFHFHKGHSTIFTSRAFLQVEKISSLFLNSSASK